MNKNILVTGGNGFIGYQTVLQLLDSGYNPIVVDWEDDPSKNSYTYSFDDRKVLGIMRDNNIETVIHLAAEHEVARSVEEPSVYYNNNVVSSIRFLDMCIQANVKNFIFSSSSSVYGDPSMIGSHGMFETMVKNPISPYARTKDMFEEILKDYEVAYGIKTLSLRYFNAAGADPYNRHGYDQEPQTHLFPVLARCFGRDEPFTINGTDYNTSDGTAVRDYTHVYDIAAAHIKAIEYLDGEIHTEWAFNIGMGGGSSVIEVIEAFRRFTGKDIRITNGPRRSGDVVRTHADNLRAAGMDWKPTLGLDDMVKNAYMWENR